MIPARLVLYHKQATSARIRFLVFASGSVCGPEPLPSSAAVDDGAAGSDPSAATVVPHPAPLARRIAGELGLGDGDLETDGRPLATVATADGPVRVFPARLTPLDPPFEAAAARGARFIDLTQARGRPAVELEILRRIYERALG